MKTSQYEQQCRYKLLCDAKTIKIPMYNTLWGMFTVCFTEHHRHLGILIVNKILRVIKVSEMLSRYSFWFINMYIFLALL